ncbi:MAG: hypothetical protein P4M05_22365 [Bradyrhizobium sp.]|nr:hypothetical protein [Bradyrhizobium sp.]
MSLRINASISSSVTGFTSLLGLNTHFAAVDLGSQDLALAIVEIPDAPQAESVTSFNICAGRGVTVDL